MVPLYPTKQSNQYIRISLQPERGFPGGSDSEESAGNVADPGSIPGSVRSPGKRNGNPLQYSLPENPMNRGVWWATIYGGAKNQT